MKIAFAGKGGTGKTSLAAWTADYLARQGHDVWLIDADTAMSLGSASGLENEEMPEPLTAQEELIQTRIGSGLLNLNPDVSDLPAKLAVEIPLQGVAMEGTELGVKRLLVMGSIATAGGGCACHANALLKAVLAHLLYDEKNWIIIDLEAGVEHLGRGTVEKVDALVVVAEPSLRSLETAKKVSELADALGVDKQVFLINRDEREASICHRLPLTLQAVLPKTCLSVPVLDSLQERMLTEASVMNLSEQALIDDCIAELINQLKTL